MAQMTSATGSLPLRLSKGETLVIKDLAGSHTVTGSLAPREDASASVGAGFVVYGPQPSAVTVTISTTGAVDYQVVSGDVTPASPASGGGAVFVKNEVTGFVETTVGADTFLALPKSGNNARANINVRTGTFAALSTLVGGNGEIAKCTDQEALFAYDGTTPGGIVFRPDSTKGVVCTVLISDTPSSGGNAENLLTNADATPLAKGTLTTPDASGIFTLNDLTGWLKITGYIYQSSDFNAGASHQLLLLASDAIGGPYSGAFELDLPPVLSQTPVNIILPLSSLGAVPAYIRFQIKNTSVDDVFGNATLCLEHIA